MTLKVALPKDYQPGRHLILPASHFRQKIGVRDADGREVSHAELRAVLHELLGAPLIRLIAHSIEHQDEPDHPYHQDALEGFHARLKGTWHIDRYAAPIEWYAAQASQSSLVHVTEDELAATPDWIQKYPKLYAEALAALQRDHKPDTSEWEETFENIFTTNGVNCLWTVVVNGLGAANTGASPAAATAAFNSTQARIGVADGTNAVSAADTDIQSSGSNKTWAVVSGAPTITNNQIAFAASFGTAAANYSWQNFAADNCGGSNATSSTRSGGTMLDHVLSNQGTKVSGQTWNPTLTLSVS